MRGIKERDNMKKKIIIVDDNPDLLYMIKREMEHLDDEFEVTGVKSGNECFNLFFSRHIIHRAIIGRCMES